MDDSDFDSENYKRQAARRIGFPIMFFKSVVNHLDQKINKVNEELRTQYSGTSEAQKQIVRLTFGLGKRIELGFGQNLVCTVALTADYSHIEAVITNEPDRPGSPTEQLSAFLLECNDTGGKMGCCEVGGILKCAEEAVKAYRIDLEPLPYALHEVGAKEIAESVVEGMVRGRFD
jgi:hypothetical protein